MKIKAINSNAPPYQLISKIIEKIEYRWNNSLSLELSNRYLYLERLLNRLQTKRRIYRWHYSMDRKVLAIIPYLTSKIFYIILRF